MQAVVVEVEERRLAKQRTLAVLVGAFAALLLALAVLLCVCWLVFSKQDSKLYQADNVVCVSQPLALHCFERKTNP